MEKETISANPPEVKERNRTKVIRDLGFLLDIKPFFVSTFTAKYVLEEGEDDILKDIKVPFEVHVGLVKYDYEGRQVHQIGTLVLPKDKGHELKEEVMSMRLGERAWFNVCNRSMHNPTPQIEVLEGGGVIIKDMDLLREEDDDSEEEDEPTGCHYELTLKHIEYKHGDSIESKRKYYSQQKQTAASHFKERKYDEALKIYRKLINVTEGLSKRLFSEEELEQFKRNNLSVRQNYVKTYLNLNDPWLEKDQYDFAEENVQMLVRIRPTDSVAHYLRAKWLLKQRHLDPAFQAAKRSWELENHMTTYELMKKIKEEKEQKGKIKRPAELSKQK